MASVPVQPGRERGGLRQHQSFVGGRIQSYQLLVEDRIAPDVMRTIRIYETTASDSERACGLLKAMLNEMASLGGHAIADKKRVSRWLNKRIQLIQESRDHLLLLAEISEVTDEPVGVLEASVSELHPVFTPKRCLHLHGIYVDPRQRRQGVGRALMTSALTWGRERGCVEADLNVLWRSPAVQFYQELGFTVFQQEMRRKI